MLIDVKVPWVIKRLECYVISARGSILSQGLKAIFTSEHRFNIVI
jgi:hypothetical protein